MSRILLVVMPFAGHVAPMRAIASELVRRGHEVRAYTGSAYAEAFESVGARHVPWREAPDFDEHRLADVFPDLGTRHGIRQVITNMEQVFIGTAARQLADLEAEWRSEPWDLMVSETTSVSAPLAAERFPAAWATVAIVPLMLPGGHRPPPGLGLVPAHGIGGRMRDRALWAAMGIAIGRLERAYARERALAGLGPASRPYAEASHSDTLTLATGGALLDFAPLPRPAWVRYVGRIAGAPAPGRPLPEWWDEVTGSDRPVVLVTQGTFNTDPEELLVPALEALAEREVLVVATLGREGAAWDRPIPANARIAGFVPFEQLMPHLDAVVTNGGWGGTLAALAAGVPLVIAGGDLDKPEIATRVRWVGAGVDLRTGRPTAAAVGRAVDRVLADPAFRAAAARVGEELAELGGVTEIADALEARAAAGEASPLP